jgi:hypothetical protein
VELIQRCGNISAMASEKTINTDYFEEYCLKTAKMIVTLYPWYYMPASVYKVLLHSADVTRFAPLPIGNINRRVSFII